ncbi:MAG: hypothetical protein IKM73_16710 [Acidaminococcaceae bacterium]|nr:hypothetical protein [Acidaminococcaceae bacterium]
MVSIRFVAGGIPEHVVVFQMGTETLSGEILIVQIAETDPHETVPFVIIPAGEFGLESLIVYEVFALGKGSHLIFHSESEE